MLVQRRSWLVILEKDSRTPVGLVEFEELLRSLPKAEQNAATLTELVVPERLQIAATASASEAAAAMSAKRARAIVVIDADQHLYGVLQADELLRFCIVGAKQTESITA